MALDAYIGQNLSRQAMKAEFLDAKTEMQLVRAWRDHRDEQTLHRLVTAYLRLAISVAARFRRYGAPMNDLIQEGSLGLIKAGLQDHVMRNWSLVRTGSTTRQKALFFNLRRVQTALQREADARGETLDQEELRQAVAKRLRVPVHDVEMMEGRLSGPDYSLNAMQSGEEEGREWIDLLEDESTRAAEAYEGEHDARLLRHWLSLAFQDLNPRERYIVTERKLRDGGRTLESLGQELGLSKERVRQLEAAAFAKMRHRLKGHTAELEHFLT